MTHSECNAIIHTYIRRVCECVDSSRSISTLSSVAASHWGPVDRKYPTDANHTWNIQYNIYILNAIQHITSNPMHMQPQTGYAIHICVVILVHLSACEAYSRYSFTYKSQCEPTQKRREQIVQCEKNCALFVWQAHETAVPISVICPIWSSRHTHTHMGKAINAHGGVASVCEHCTIVTE